MIRARERERRVRGRRHRTYIAVGDDRRPRDRSTRRGGSLAPSVADEKTRGPVDPAGRERGRFLHPRGRCPRCLEVAFSSATSTSDRHRQSRACGLLRCSPPDMGSPGLALDRLDQIGGEFSRDLSPCAFLNRSMNTVPASTGYAQPPGAHQLMVRIDGWIGSVGPHPRRPAPDGRDTVARRL